MQVKDMRDDLWQQRTSNWLACALGVGKLVIHCSIESIPYVHRPLGSKLPDH